MSYFVSRSCLDYVDENYFKVFVFIDAIGIRNITLL